MGSPRRKSGRLTRIPRYRRVAIRLLMSVLIVLIVAEVSVRLLGVVDHLVSDPIFAPSPDPAIGYLYKPNSVGTAVGRTSVRINSFGCRDREYPLAKAAGGVRVVVMGASITFGHGVDEKQSFPELLESSLSKNVDQPVEVINFGVQGYSIRQILARYHRDARPFQPDIAVIAFSSGVLNLNREDSIVDSAGYLNKKVGGFIWLKKYLRKFHLLYLVKEVYLKRIFYKSDKYLRRGLTTANLDDRLNLLETEMRRFQSSTAKDGVVPLTFLLDIQESEINTAIIRRLNEAFPDLITVDARPLFQDRARAEVVIPRDGHPNELGHRLFASALEPVVLDIVQKHSVLNSTYR